MHPIHRIALLLALAPATALASDHLDTPTVIGDPAADIADLFAWTAPDGRHLNLVLTVVGGKFSDRVRYVVHVDSGKALGKTTVTQEFVCEFDADQTARCSFGNDRVHGHADLPQGLRSERRSFQLFAGLRDDPFFNNVRGTRAAYNVAAAAMNAGAARDAGGCPTLDAPTAAKVFDEWRHTEGHEGTSLLAGWKVGAIAVSVDLRAVNHGGPLLGVWASTHRRSATAGEIGPPIDRIGRALTGNALIETFGTEAASNARKEQYNRTGPSGWQDFARDLAVNLANYDGFDGHCGNAWMAGKGTEAYLPLARLLADDRLWVDSREKVCSRYMAVELAQFPLGTSAPRDCGGRTPGYDASDVFRSLLVMGAVTGVDDGVARDDHETSNGVFPFLVP
jgi:hypothetical protein